MKRFKKILAGVDLSHGDLLVSDELPPATRQRIHRAVGLAKLHSAELRFFYALDLSPETRHLIRHSFGLEPDVLDLAEAALAKIVQESQEQGVKAGSAVTFGKSWMELIRLVLREGYDLVMVGSRRRGPIAGALLGSTALKLLRKCPCPVWVTQPQPDSEISAILVATDFTPACGLALEHGASLAQLLGCELHVLHVMEFPEAQLDKLGVPASQIQQQRTKWQQEVQRRLDEHLKQPQAAKLKRRIRLHLLEGEPPQVIRQQTEKLGIDLLVMGTVARAGLSGILAGNTAERILAEVSCSVLAVKPPGFQSPVTLDPDPEI